MSQIAISMVTIQRNLQGHKEEVQLQVKMCVKEYEQGLSQIDRSRNEWALKPSVTIEDLHSYFVKAYKYMEGASKKVSDCKDGLEVNSRDMAQQSTQLSEDIRKLTQNLNGLTAGIESKEKDVKRKSDNLSSLRRDLSSKKQELEEQTTKRNVALGVSATMAATALGLVVFGPASLPSLAAAAAADATAAACLVVIIALQKDIKDLETKIDSSQEECRLTSKELDDLKEDKRKLQSEKDSKTNQRKSLEDSSDKLRKLITEVSEYLKQVKACYTTLGTIVNKFENLKDESDPDYCTNLSALKIPVGELENSLRHKMITF